MSVRLAKPIAAQTCIVKTPSGPIDVFVSAALKTLMTPLVLVSSRYYEKIVSLIHCLLFAPKKET